jgi:5-formyltetrahydrofolate cyclo-ligase
MTLSRNELRQSMRVRRRDISKEAAQRAAEQLASKILDLFFLKNCQHIAGYIANDGEISPAVLSKKLQALGKSYYLPVLDEQRANHLIFVKYRSGDSLKMNRYQIPEPHVLAEDQRAPESLDLVLMPLVVFDAEGGRLGMGGGFYDRTFEFLRKSQTKKPLLIGLAYEFQRVDEIKNEEWDVPLDMVVTEDHVYEINFATFLNAQ